MKEQVGTIDMIARTHLPGRESFDKCFGLWSDTSDCIKIYWQKTKGN